MTVLRDISFLWSMLHIIIFFLLLFEPRFSWRTTFIASFSGAWVLLAVNVLAMFWMGHGIIMQIAFFSCTIPTLLLFFALSKYRDGRFFFLFCLSDTVCFWLLQITNFLDRLAGDTYAVLLISRLILFPVMELLFWRYLRRPYLELQAKLVKNWWLFAAVGGVYYLLIMVTSVPVGTPMPDAIGLARIILVLILMPLTYLTILCSLWRQMQIYESAKQLELQRRDHEAVYRKMELGRAYRHDMRHHLSTLEGLLLQGAVQDAQQYISSLTNQFSAVEQDVWCGNAAVNAVLSSYIGQAKQCGCSVETRVRLPDSFPFDEADVCIIFANALENAVNACQEVPCGDERLIKLAARLNDSRRLTIAVSNPCPHAVEFDGGGLPIPRQREGHGYGLRNVRAVVRKYNGMLQCQCEGGQFRFHAVLFDSGQRAEPGAFAL